MFMDVYVLRVYVLKIYIHGFPCSHGICSQDLFHLMSRFSGSTVCSWMSMFSGSMFPGSMFPDSLPPTVRVYAVAVVGTRFHQVPGHFRELILIPVSDAGRVRVLDFTSILSAFLSFPSTALQFLLARSPVLLYKSKHCDPYTISSSN